jgi:predicted amidophosphoribosyltransferase
MKCGKKTYITQQAAEETLARLKIKYRKNRVCGNSYKRLESYRCPACGLWHLGRANKLPKNYSKPAPAPKAQSLGAIRRKLERMARDWERQDDYQRKQRAAAIGKIIEAEKALEESSAEVAAYTRLIADQFLGRA